MEDMLNIEEMLKVINSTGYIIIKNIISINTDDITNLEKQINTNKIYIFNDHWDNNDKTRYQTVLNEDSISFIPQLNKIINSINPLLQKSNWVIIKSEIGCKKQMAHLDYVPTPEFNKIVNGFDKNRIPLLVLTSLMDNTYIHIWDKSIDIINGSYTGEPISSSKILLNKGDVIVFRSDVIHGGSEYDTENIRLHCYLDSPDLCREDDTTFIIKLDAPELNSLIIE